MAWRLLNGLASPWAMARRSPIWGIWAWRAWGLPGRWPDGGRKNTVARRTRRLLPHLTCLWGHVKSIVSTEQHSGKNCMNAAIGMIFIGRFPRLIKASSTHLLYGNDFSNSKCVPKIFWVWRDIFFARGRILLMGAAAGRSNNRALPPEYRTIYIYFVVLKGEILFMLWSLQLYRYNNCSKTITPGPNWNN